MAAVQWTRGEWMKSEKKKRKHDRRGERTERKRERERETKKRIEKRAGEPKMVRNAISAHTNWKVVLTADERVYFFKRKF